MPKHLIALALLFPLITSAQTATSTTVALEALIKQLQARITELQAQVQSLKTELKITRVLTQGIRGEDVKQLQEFLKTIPDVYPEGLVTGYFGPLTKAAVQRFQEKQRIVTPGSPETTGFGVVGPRTISKINELISTGAGTSGVVPPGLSPVGSAAVIPVATGATPVGQSASQTTSVSTVISSGGVISIAPTQTTSASPSPAAIASTTTTTASTAVTVATTTGSAATGTSSLSTPQNFLMTSGAPGMLNFSWQVPAENIGLAYKIYLTNTNTNTATVLDQGASYGTGSRSFGQGGYMQGVQYSAYIVTIGSSGNMSAPSPTLSATVQQLTTPTNFRASATGPTSVSLTWTASQGSVYQYQIRRFSGNLDGAQNSVMVLVPATSYTDTTVSPSTAYIYWIEARNESGNGADTASASVTTPAASSGGSATTSSLLPNPTLNQIAGVLEAMQRVLNQIRELSQ